MMHISVFTDDKEDIQQEITRILEYAAEHSLKALPMELSDDGGYAIDGQATWFAIDAYLLDEKEYAFWMREQETFFDDLPF